jgi:hypothetical protein
MNFKNKFFNVNKKPMTRDKLVSILNDDLKWNVDNPQHYLKLLRKIESHHGIDSTNNSSIIESLINRPFLSIVTVIIISSIIFYWNGTTRNVILPNGQVVSNVPRSVSDAEILKKYNIMISERSKSNNELLNQLRTDESNRLARESLDQINQLRSESANRESQRQIDEMIRSNNEAARRLSEQFLNSSK